MFQFAQVIDEACRSFNHIFLSPFFSSPVFCHHGHPYSRVIQLSTLLFHKLFHLNPPCVSLVFFSVFTFDNWDGWRWMLDVASAVYLDMQDGGESKQSAFVWNTISKWNWGESFSLCSLSQWSHTHTHTHTHTHNLGCVGPGFGFFTHHSIH